MPVRHVRARAHGYGGYAVTFALSQLADCARPRKVTRGEAPHLLAAGAARADSPPGHDRAGITLAGTAQTSARSRTAENSRQPAPSWTRRYKETCAMSSVQINVSAPGDSEMTSASRMAHVLDRRAPARRPLPRCTSWQSPGSGRRRWRTQPRRRPDRLPFRRLPAVPS